MTPRLFSGIFALWMALAGAAASQGPVVVELYTSQGCSSCPPADAMLRELAGRDDVIALSLHVDYWDYIGWADEFADPAHAKRQRAFAHEAGRRSVYTPQLIVNGRDSIVGAKAMKLADTITAHAAKPMPVQVSAVRSGDTVRISAPASPLAGPLIVQTVRYTPERRAKITRGENAGHTLAYANVAQDWSVVSTWDGQTALSLEVASPGDLPLVVLVQQGTAGPIVGAARLR
ncbi:MAG: DUF1223 domain-containing protein [Pseudomonadota bacterium]